jgi:transaldolase
VNLLEQLKQHTVVVADTGDFLTMLAYAPRDATTNPSLILKAVRNVDYRHLLEEVVREHRDDGTAVVIDHLLVRFGLEILRLVPGRVSTEIDARLSFDAEGTIARARTLAALYQAAGVPRNRFLIKIAATWEGICAARVLEQEGIRCNLTLIFSLVQAAACAEAGVQLISPFVGRISDWYKKSTGREYAAAEDPGVLSVKRIFDYYVAHGYPTEVMGASFRSVEQIVELAGCDLLTISPGLLGQLAQRQGTLVRKLEGGAGAACDAPEPVLNQSSFLLQLNDDAMACEQLASGIRQFCADTDCLERLIESLR